MNRSLTTFIKWFCAGLLLAGTQACMVKPADPHAVAQQKREVAPAVMKKYRAALQLMKLGNLDAALKVFAGVSKMDDTLSGPYVNSGLIYLQQDKKQQAKAAFEQAVARNPDNATALMQLAVLQRESFAFDEARKHYEKALVSRPDLANGHLNLGILCDIYLRDHDCALQHYQEYQRIHGEDETVNNWVIDLKGRM